jgi:hypothetical protein
MPEIQPNTPMEEKLFAATRVPKPRAEFLAALSARLAEQTRQDNPPYETKLSFSIHDWLSGLFRRPVWLTMLIILGILTAVSLAVGPQRVIAALGNLLGYLPGIGLVQNGAGLRVLSNPVQEQREGITLTVEQAAADPQHTVVVYRVEGLSIQAANSQGEGASTGGLAVMQLPDGSILTQTGGGGPGWGSGYQMRLVFPALPVGVNQATLMISRLESMPAGAAPEDWRLPIQFEPSPSNLKVMPVYELATPQSTLSQVVQTSIPETETPAAAVLTASTPTRAAGTNDDLHNGVHFRLDKVVDLGNGYQFQGVLTWEGQPYSNVSLDPSTIQPYVLTDGNDQPVLYEEAESDPVGTSSGSASMPWAIRTNRKDFPGPVRLSVARLLASQPLSNSQASLKIDFGSQPQPGQTWALGQDVNVAGQRLHAVSARLENNPREGNPVLTLIFETTPNITSLGIEDAQNQPDAAHPGAGGGGGGGPAETETPGRITASIAYGQLPTGVHQIQISSLTSQIDGPWTVTWNPPAAGQPVIATPSAAACLTSVKWQQVKDQPSSGLPGELSGRLLVEEDQGHWMPEMKILNLAGGRPQDLIPGGWSSLSPDGKTAAFIENSGPGLMLLDIASGQKQMVPGTSPEDYHPVWSPDGQRLAFVRGSAGIFIIARAGSRLRKAVDASRIRSLAGWLPDSQGLVITSLGQGGSQVQVVNLQTGAIQDQFIIQNAKGGFVQLSPDGKRMAFSEMTFGLPSYGIYTANLDGSEKRLLAGLESGGATAGAWSPDGKWLALTVTEMEGSAEVERIGLIAVDVCQIQVIPGIRGRVTGWAPE